MTSSKRTLPSAASPEMFVGRADELTLLQAAAAAARRGQPKVVFIEGEAGIGKSSLLTRLTAEPESASVLRASGDEAESLLSYGVVGQLVASARGIGDPPSGLLAADLSDGLDPLAVGAELVTWLGQLSRGREITLALIDDLQWADRPSARALLFAVGRLQADPVLVVVTARPGGLSRGAPGSVSWPEITGPARSAWPAWSRGMWLRWAGRWASAICRPGRWAV